MKYKDTLSLSKIAKIRSLTRNNKPFDQDNLFNLDNVFHPIREENGEVVIYSRVIKSGNVVNDRYTVDQSLSELYDIFNDPASAYAENIGLALFDVVAINNEPYDGQMLLPVANMAMPAYGVPRVTLKNGSVLTGSYTAITYLDKSGQGQSTFYVDATLTEAETTMNEFGSGLDRVIRLYTYWRDFKTTMNADAKFPSWVLYPIELIQAPVEDNVQYAKPGEPNGIVINILERSVNRIVPYKVSSSLDNLIANLTSPGATSLTFDVVNGNTPIFNG